MADDQTLTTGHLVGVALHGPDCENDACYVTGVLVAHDAIGVRIDRYNWDRNRPSGAQVTYRWDAIAFIDQPVGSLYDVRQTFEKALNNWRQRHRRRPIDAGAE